MKGLAFIGLDIESTGSRVDHHRPIQLGICSVENPADGFESLIWQEDDCPIDPEAETVHHIAKERWNCPATPSASGVDRMAVEWLTERFGERRCVPVGLNVGSFDVAMLRPQFPKLCAKMGYQSVDLNAVLFTLAVARGREFHKLKDDLKVDARSILNGMGFATHEHDALYDARLAAEMWKRLVGDARNCAEDGGASFDAPPLFMSP